MVLQEPVRHRQPGNLVGRGRETQWNRTNEVWNSREGGREEENRIGGWEGGRKGGREVRKQNRIRGREGGRKDRWEGGRGREGEKELDKH